MGFVTSMSSSLHFVQRYRRARLHYLESVLAEKTLGGPVQYFSGMTIKETATQPHKEKHNGTQETSRRRCRDGEAEEATVGLQGRARQFAGRNVEEKR
jgi:hypothetical protein